MDQIGDLKWGVRYTRLKVQGNYWPRNERTENRDRSSWIASFLRKALFKELKANEKKSYMKLIK